MKTHVVVHPLGEPGVHLLGPWIQPAEGLDGSGVDLPGHEVLVEGLPAYMAGQGAPTLDQSSGDRS